MQHGRLTVTPQVEDDGGDILKVSEGRWQIEACYRIMKTDFSARRERDLCETEALTEPAAETVSQGTFSTL